MDIARMLNVTILACLLILTGCFGLFDDGDVIDDAEGDDTDSGSTTVVNNYYNNTSTASGTPPTVQIMGGDGWGYDAEPIPIFNSSTGDLEGYTGYYTSIYYAMLDVDGTITSAGFDIDLDGTIDVPVSESRGVVNLTIPISEWVVSEGDEDEYNDGWVDITTTVAFIAIDDDSLYTVEMYSLTMQETNNDDEPEPSMYVLSAADHTDDVEDDSGLMTLIFGNGNDLDWALVQIEIIKDSVPFTCDNPDLTGGNCAASQHGGADATSWEKGETIILASTGGAFCDADCTLTVRIKYNGDVVMSAAVHMI
jgi:hypothetical protein